MGSIGHLVAGKPVAFSTFPTLQQWKDKSSVALASRGNDRVLVTIDTLVEAYNQTKAASKESGQNAYLLGQLFFATLYWINNHQKDASHMLAGRRPAIISLNFTVTNELATVLGCGPGDVGARLYSIYGKSLSPHGVNMDKNSNHYLDAAKRQQWRVVFRGGKAYGFSDTTASMNSLALLDTEKYAQIHKDVGDEGRNGDCGYILGMSNDLYVGPLLGRMGRETRLREGFISREQSKTPFDLKNAPVFHSSFTGWPVQSAGMITIRGGIVTELTLASGHYMPDDPGLIQVLQLLKSVGMDVTKIDLWDKGQNTVEAEGREGLLEEVGNWKGMREAHCQEVWAEYQKAGLRVLVQKRFDSFKGSFGKSMSDEELWKKAYQNVCWDLAVFDPKFKQRADQPPIPRLPPPPTGQRLQPPKKGV